jgi:hypothetical protein
MPFLYWFLCTRSACDWYPEDQGLNLKECTATSPRCVDRHSKTLHAVFPNLRISANLPTSSNSDDSSCPDPTSERAEDFQLLLPSEICDDMPCNMILLETEWSLCLAQATDALNKCYSHIRLCRQLYQFKVQHLRGQGPHIHSRKTIDAVDYVVYLVNSQNFFWRPRGYSKTVSRLISLILLLYAELY